MKLDKSKVISILLEEAKKDPQVLIKVVELLPTLIAVYERIVAEAKKEGSDSPKGEVGSPPPSTDPPSAWLENAFHSWYQDTPDASDMTTTEEVRAIVDGKATVPPGASLWLMSNSPRAFWCFSLDSGPVITFKQEGEQKVWMGPVDSVFLGARYKEQPDGVKDARHIIARLKVLDEPHQLTFWVLDGTVASEPVTISLAGKKL